MWRRISRHLPGFSSAVLTGLDGAGDPASLRCRPRLDAESQTIRLALPAWCELAPGPASLLCHQHDARLWRLKSLLIRGTLAKEGQDWVFRPRRFVPGMGIGPLSYARFALAGRRAAARYLSRRGLPRPRIPWEEIREALGG